MNVLLVRDGTVPLAIARILATDDGIESLDEYLAENTDGNVEVHAVEDDAQYIGACWFDGDGFTLVGFTDVREGFEWLAEDEFTETGTVKVETYAQGHWGASYPSGDPDDPRGYGHLFQL